MQRNAELFFNQGQVCGDTNSLKKAKQNTDLKKNQRIYSKYL